MKIGLDIGGSHISIGVVKEDKILDLVYEQEIKISDAEKPKETLLNNIIILIDKILNEFANIPLECIGIACPGTIRNGKIIRAENLNISEKDIEDDKVISKILESRYNTKVSIRNDAKCAGLAEMKLGSLKGYKDSVFLTLGTGIGGAVFLDGKMLEPIRNSGFEVGHMVIDIDGDKCSCGRKGCFEMLASMRKFKSEIKKELNLPNEITGIEIRRLLEDEKNYRSSEKAINNYIYSLSIGIANLINLFEPEIISIGGSFVHYKEFLLNKLEEELGKKDAIFNGENIPKIVTAQLGNEAGIIGAVL